MHGGWSAGSREAENLQKGATKECPSRLERKKLGGFDPTKELLLASEWPCDEHGAIDILREREAE